VPDVLLSGDHRAIARWRREQSQARGKEIDTETTLTDIGDNYEE
jgi:tRNA G37 N-methylase TrmD